MLATFCFPLLFQLVLKTTKAIILFSQTHKNILYFYSQFPVLFLCQPCEKRKITKMFIQLVCSCCSRKILNVLQQKQQQQWNLFRFVVTAVADICFIRHFCGLSMAKEGFLTTKMKAASGLHMFLLTQTHTYSFPNTSSQFFPFFFCMF